MRYLAGECGIRQFLDIGTGLPAADNTHEVAQALAPEARVVYVDNDPIVLAHARALLTSHDQGATDYLDADLRDTARILRDAAATLDFSQPVAVMHPAIDIHAGVRRAVPKMNELMRTRLTFRSRDQVTALFDGLELVGPGVVRIPDWRPRSAEEAANPSAVWGGAGRKNG